ncbi:MAG: potassium channel family protein [Candidatus Geothermincolia bacterium]
MPLLIVVITFFVLLISLPLLFFEKNVNPSVAGYGDALWMSFVVIAPTASRAIAPVTLGGRIVGALGIIGGIGFLGLFTATLATALVGMVLRHAGGADSFHCKRHVVICGWNQRGRHVWDELCEELAREECPILILADLPSPPLADDRAIFIRGQAQNYEDLQRVNLAEARGVIILADDTVPGAKGDIDARTILSAFAIHESNPRARIVAEILEPSNVRHAEVAGVSEILVPNRLMGHALARSSLHYGLIGVLSELLSTRFGNQIYKIPVPRQLVGSGYETALLSLHRERGQTLIAVNRQGRVWTDPSGLVLEAGDELFIIAHLQPPDRPIKER